MPIQKKNCDTEQIKRYLKNRRHFSQAATQKLSNRTAFIIQKKHSHSNILTRLSSHIKISYNLILTELPIVVDEKIFTILRQQVNIHNSNREKKSSFSI